ncbi:hypothetical protein Acr_15g0003280 [Actinidia rufa]|uniref:Integrase catalytic domain-containing protein n=1 Tax=Actinidia rufa TaxID=165716 RepID=A0A7J0FSN6_9ERIC|nr:hypothetical protein Acr_15g0003280 [Actinidia rufa]
MNMDWASHDHPGLCLARSPFLGRHKLDTPSSLACFPALSISVRSSARPSHQENRNPSQHKQCNLEFYGSWSPMVSPKVTYLRTLLTEGKTSPWNFAKSSPMSSPEPPSECSSARQEPGVFASSPAVYFVRLCCRLLSPSPCQGYENITVVHGQFSPLGVYIRRPSPPAATWQASFSPWIISLHSNASQVPDLEVPNEQGLGAEQPSPSLLLRSSSSESSLLEPGKRGGAPTEAIITAGTRQIYLAERFEIWTHRLMPLILGTNAPDGYEIYTPICAHLSNLYTGILRGYNKRSDQKVESANASSRHEGSKTSSVPDHPIAIYRTGDDAEDFWFTKRGIEVNPDQIKPLITMSSTSSRSNKLTGRVAAPTDLSPSLRTKCLPFSKFPKEKQGFQWNEELKMHPTAERITQALEPPIKSSKRKKIRRGWTKLLPISGMGSCQKISSKLAASNTDPQEEAEYVLREIHEGICGNHSGARSLAKKTIRQGYFLADHRTRRGSIYKRCDKCQRYAPVSRLPHTEMVPMSSPWPFAQWGIDILGPLPRAPLQKKFLIVAIDYFTKWIEAQPLAKITEKNTRDFVWKHLVCRFGVPKVYHLGQRKAVRQRQVQVILFGSRHLPSFLLARSSSS